MISLSRSSVLRLIMVAMLAISGCGYVVGQPYDQQIRSVHVPIFRNETFRRGIELQLTEAVQKQIQLQTPFRLAKGNADTQLTGRIVSVDKRVPNQTKYDDPRELELAIVVEVTWRDLRSGRVLAQNQIPVDGRTAHAIVNTSFAPEAGQSLATATQDAVNQLAQQIVGLMEAPW